MRGRLTGFAENADGTVGTRPVRDFRAWLWQDNRCAPEAASAVAAPAIVAAQNAPHAGVEQVVFDEGSGTGEAVWVRADEYALEDVVTHVPRNADRYRPAGTAITIGLAATVTQVEVTLLQRRPANRRSDAGKHL